MLRIKFAAVILHTCGWFERCLEAALLQIEAKYFIANNFKLTKNVSIKHDIKFQLPGSHKIKITRGVVVVKVSAKLGNSYFVIFAVLGVKFDVAIVVKEDNFGVIVGQDFEFDALRVEAALKFHWVLSEVKTFHFWLVNTWIKKVLNQVNLEISCLDSNKNTVWKAVLPWWHLINIMLFELLTMSMSKYWISSESPEWVPFLPMLYIILSN